MRLALFAATVVFALGNSLTAQDRSNSGPTGTQQQTEELFSAITSGDIEQVRELIDNGVDINAKQFLLTPFMRANQTGFLQIATLLKEKGADTSIPRPAIGEVLNVVLADSVGDDKPGYAFLVCRDGKVIAEECFGMANVEQKIPIKPDMQFLIGSVTKQFTATAILKLQEDGKLSVDDKLSKYIKDFHRGDEITLHHLLTHTSGITNYTSGPVFMLTHKLPTTEENLIASFKLNKLQFDPGQRYSYCNSGYFLLGHIVRKVSGQSLGSYLKKEVFDPLRMKDTGFHESRWDKAGEASGYRVTENEVTATKTWHMTHAGGAGAMYSNVRDLMAWNEALFGGEVLSADSMKAAFAPTKLNDGSTSDYGYGFGIGKRRGLKMISHAGGLEGFLSYLVRFPEHNTTVVALHNASPNHGMMSHIETSLQIAEYVLWKDMRPREVRELDKSVDPMTFKDYVGTYDYGSPVIMNVTLEDGQLYAQLSGQSKLAIYPLKDNTFFWKVVNAEVEFERDAAGRVVAAIHRQNGSDNRHPRTEDKALIGISPKDLDQYVGHYDYGAALMEITRDGPKLMAQLPGQPKLAIFPTAKHKFQWAAVDAKIEFVVDEDGNVIAGKHTQNGRTFKAAKVETKPTIKLSAKVLQDYVGKYNYGLLGGNMSVTIEDDKLMAQLRGQPKLQLLPIGKDRFRWKDVNASIKFIRSQDGSVSHGMHKQGGAESKVAKVQ